MDGHGEGRAVVVGGGITRQLVDAGAPSGDLLADTRLHLGGHRFARTHADLTTVSVPGASSTRTGTEGTGSARQEIAR